MAEGPEAQIVSIIDAAVERRVKEMTEAVSRALASAAERSAWRDGGGPS